jgi:hypothetical protein
VAGKLVVARRIVGWRRQRWLGSLDSPATQATLRVVCAMYGVPPDVIRSPLPEAQLPRDGSGIELRETRHGTEVWRVWP